MVGVTDSNPADCRGAGSADTNSGEDSLETTVQELSARMDALSKQISGFREELHDKREQREELENAACHRIRLTSPYLTIT